jgi:hypothetical protein
MPDASTSFADAVDARHAAESSAVLRYRRVPRFEADDATNARLLSLFEQHSIREGLRLFPLVRYRGVDLHVLDETSLMHTGSLKSIDGCVTTARCLLAGYDRVCFESGGNTGTALTAYATRAGLQSILFLPARGVPLLDSRIFGHDRAHVVAVDDTAWVKAAAQAFARRSGLPRVPRRDWRLDASTIIGCFLLERLLQGAAFDYLFQTISAAFAPIGIYRVLREHGQLPRAPRFVGVQQAALSPMFDRWAAESGAPMPNGHATAGSALSKVIYDGAPEEYGTYPDLRRLLEDTRGRLTTLHSEDFALVTSALDGGPSVLELLRDHDVDITLQDGDVLEKTGLIALAKVLHEIRAGVIEEGARVVVCVTGGTARPDGKVRPDYRIRDAGDHSEAIERALASRRIHRA